MFAESFRSSKTFTTLVVCVALFTDVVLQACVIPVLPYALEQRVGLLHEEEIQRWNSILLASFGGAMMFGSVFLGWIGDKLPNRRTPFMLGLVLLAASTICFALGRNLPELLLARILEGCSAAVVGTLGMALLNQVVGPERIGKAMGYTSTAVSSGLLLGPVVGGFLYEFGGYFAVFYPAFGLLLMEAILRLLVIEGKAAGGPDGRRHVIDSTSDPTHKHGSPTPKHALSAANDGGTADKAGDSETAVLLVKPRVSSNAPLVLLGSPRLLTAILGNFALVSIGCGFDAVLTPYIKDEFDLKATHAAALFLCLGLPMFLAPISGALTDRYGAKWPVASGFAIAIPSLILLRLVTTGTSQPFLKLAILLFFIGIAIALAISPLNAEAPKVVKALERKSPGVFGPYGVYTQAYGLMNAASAAGAMVGPLYTGFVRVWLGWGAMSLSLGIICVVMLVLVISFSGEKPGRGDDTTERSDEGA